ncbi:Phosphatidylinositol 4-kinase beta, partial [Nosema bombycis CQ1]
LKKLFNADYFDAWLAVSYLYRYPTVGIHYYICNKLQYSKDVIVVLPQLVHVYLYHADTEVSIPIYNLLKVLSSKSKRFFCAIYFYLKAYIDSEDTKKSIYCYFLICDIFQEEKKILLRNTKILRTQLQYKRRIGRTQGIGRETKGHHSFDGIFLYFLKSVTWMLDGDDDLNKEIINYENIFIPSKNISNINLNLELDSGSAFRSESLKSSINLLLTLIEISQRLKKLPKNLRQKGLEMELKLINCNLPGKLSLPFSTSNYILNIQIELSHVLNSADNVPYVVVFEVADQGISSNTHVNDELRNASLIMQQLNTVSGLAYLSDINNIKENVISSLEKILNTERSPVPITTYSEKQIKRKEIISKKVSERVQKLTSNKKEKNNDKVDKVIDKIEIDIDYDSIFFTNKNDKLPNESSINLDSSKNIIDFYQDDWKIKEKNIKNKSPYSHLKGWRLSSMIVKTGNNLKQEIVAYQILNEMKKIWNDE